MASFMEALRGEVLAIQQQALVGLAAMAKLATPESRLTGARERKVRENNGSVAVIRLQGPISNRGSIISEMLGLPSTELIESTIRAALSEDEIKAIVLDINSPGGSAAGTPELGAFLQSVRGGSKPIISQVNSLAASAAYWIASNTDEIVATPSSQVGSIGVIAVHSEDSKMMADMGVTETVITSAPFKGEGNPYEPLSDEGRQEIQSMVNKLHGMFIEAVAAGRNTDKDNVERNFGQGRTLLAGDAKRIGMIDRVGTMRDTLERLGAFVEPRRARAGNARAVAFERKRLHLEQAAR